MESSIKLDYKKYIYVVMIRVAKSHGNVQMSKIT